MSTGDPKKVGTASFIRGWVLMKFKLASDRSLLLFVQEPVKRSQVIHNIIKDRTEEKMKLLLWYLCQWNKFVMEHAGISYATSVTPIKIWMQKWFITLQESTFYTSTPLPTGLPQKGLGRHEEENEIFVHKTVLAVLCMHVNLFN